MASPTPPATEAPTSPEKFSISFKEAQDAIARALEAQGVADRIKVVIPRRADSAIASYREPLTMQIDQLTFDKNFLTWQAVAYFSAGSKPLAPVKLSGRYEEVVEVPILKRRVNHGELIVESNIEMQEFGTNRLRGEIVSSAAQLIGKTPKRSISALRPIRTDEIGTPAIVHKGETVSIMYKTPSMEIKTVGEALENGAEGDIIKIRNPESHNVIQATITGKGTAEIAPASTATSRATP